ncbi:MAG: ChaN family lipoprotein [Gemmatimonadetes bacterium]|nr:ChaN family lipoprotein [Gemmatimonadota bacterium]MBK7715446.1 ChaN family lipoprotein [Gemmatimonadota bacterium]MBK9066729.1 ChaN family lipoprotein [Gemmatimonadota bacterium]
MRNTLLWAPALLLAACGGTAPAAAPVAPAAALALPESTVVLDAATGAPIASAELLRRARAADFVLLGEIHDNIAHHQVRGALLTAAGRHPAVVFEQFARSAGPIPPPAGGTADDAWLDQYGFDRKNWRWPLHQPVVQAALASGQGVWGSGLPRETLRAVVRGGAAAAPPELRAIIEQAPLDSVARAAIDRELFEGHCGKLPAEMVPGMRAAQELRDASMAEALLTAAKGGGPAWLIAGDGHVRADMAVPRMLRRVAPGKTLLIVGVVERGTEAAVPGPEAARQYQVLIVTPPAAREDPCASL